MAITTSTVYAGITVGSTPSAASNAFKQAATADTRFYTLHATYTNGARQHNIQKFVKIWHTYSAVNITAAAALSQLRLQADHFDLDRIDQLPTAVTILKSKQAVGDGGYFFCWVEEPTLNTAATLSLQLVETT